MRRAGKSVNLNMLQWFFQLNLDANNNPITGADELKECENYKLFAGGVQKYMEETWDPPKTQIMEETAIVE